MERPDRIFDGILPPSPFPRGNYLVVAGRTLLPTSIQGLRFLMTSYIYIQHNYIPHLSIIIGRHTFDGMGFFSEGYLTKGR